MTKLADRKMPMYAASEIAWRGKRRGYTLVEMMVVISLISIAFTGVALTMHLLQRVNNQLRNDFPQSDAMLRLTLRVRADAHQATHFSMEQNADGGPDAHFRESDGLDIVYRKQMSTIVRTVHKDSQPIHHDRFRCAHETELHWLTEGDPPSVVSMVLKRNKGRMHESLDSIQFDRIDAAIGMATGATK